MKLKLLLLRLLQVIGFLISLLGVFLGIAFLGGILAFICRLGCGDKLDSELVMILVIGIVCAPLCKGCLVAGIWAIDQFKNYKTKIDQKEEARKRQEFDAWQKAYTAKIEAERREEEARYRAMTPEQRRKYDEEKEREMKAWRLRQALQGAFSDPAVGTIAYDHDELDAVARAMEITRTYGTDWIGYDPEAPGPDPDAYSPPGYDPEAYTGDIY